MTKQVTIHVVNKLTGEYVQSKTTRRNLEQRLGMLKYNVMSINGQGTAVFDRFKPFIGVDLKDIEFRVYTLDEVRTADSIKNITYIPKNPAVDE